MVVDLKDCATRGGALLFWKRIGFDGTADDCRDGAGQRMLLNAQAPSCIDACAFGQWRECGDILAAAAARGAARR